MTISEVSGNEFVAAQTRQIEREFGTSRPSPRHLAMGFKPRSGRPGRQEIGSNQPAEAGKTKRLDETI